MCRLTNPTHLLEKASLAELEELVESVDRSDLPAGGGLGVGQMAHVQLTLLEQGNELLGDLLHQDTVVTLSGHTGMGEGNELTKAVHREVTLTTATLTAGGGDALSVPGNKGLDDTAKTDNLLGIGGVLLQRGSSPTLLAVVQSNVQNDSLSKQGQESLLLQLVNHDGGITIGQKLAC